MVRWGKEGRFFDLLSRAGNFHLGCKRKPEMAKAKNMAVGQTNGTPAICRKVVFDDKILPWGREGRTCRHKLTSCGATDTEFSATGMHTRNFMLERRRSLNF